MGERRIRELVGVRTKRYRGLGALASVKYVFVAPLPVYTPLDLLPLFGSNNHRPHEDWDPDGNMAGQPRF
jgi:hypothetical protein